MNSDESFRNIRDAVEDEEFSESLKEDVRQKSETARIRRLQARHGRRIIQGGDPRRFGDRVVWKS